MGKNDLFSLDGHLDGMGGNTELRRSLGCSLNTLFRKQASIISKKEEYGHWCQMYEQKHEDHENEWGRGGTWYC